MQGDQSPNEFILNINSIKFDFETLILTSDLNYCYKPVNPAQSQPVRMEHGMSFGAPAKFVCPMHEKVNGCANLFVTV